MGKRSDVGAAVVADAKRLLSKVVKNPPGLVIDCGSNLGQGFTFFRQYYPLSLYDYVLVEPNPYCIGHLSKMREELGGNIDIIAEAASTQAGEARFYGLTEDARGKASNGGSILRNHNSLYYTADEHHAISVRTFCLRDLIQKKIDSGYSAIVMKLDIEGSEYHVLDDLIAHNMHTLIDVLYIEFHSRYMEEIDRKHYESREIEIVNKLQQDSVLYTIWV